MEMPEAAAPLDEWTAWVKANLDDLMALVAASPPVARTELVDVRPNFDGLPFIRLQYSNGADVLITPRMLRESGSYASATDMLYDLMDQGLVDIAPTEFGPDNSLYLTFKVLVPFMVPTDDHRFGVPARLLCHFPSDEWGQA